MSTPPPSPSNVGHGAEEERGKGAEEETGKATKTVKAEAGEDGGALINIKVHSQTADDVFFRMHQARREAAAAHGHVLRQALAPPQGRPVPRP